MEFIGALVTYLMMTYCVVGGISYIVNDQSELGRVSQDGLHTTANMFIPIYGLMASVPPLKVFISRVSGPVFTLFDGDPVVAVAITMPPDCDSFTLATEIGQGADLFPVIVATGSMCVSTIASDVPISLSMLDEGDHKYLTLGTTSDFLFASFGVFITSVIAMLTRPAIRSIFSSVGEPDHVVISTLGMLLHNMIPLVIICVLLALRLKFFPNGMIKGFTASEKLMTGALTLVAMAYILQHYTGLFTDILGIGWSFDPTLADEENTFRAVGLLGIIAMMLTGTFPMVALIYRYLGKPLEKLGRLAGLEASGSVGLVTCLPDGLAMFSFVKEICPRDKVVYMAFLACDGYGLGDFLAFSVSFQPNLSVPVFVGQICGGVTDIAFVKLLVVLQVWALEWKTAVRDVRSGPSWSAPRVVVPHLGQQKRAFIWMSTLSKFNAIQILQSLDGPT